MIGTILITLTDLCSFALNLEFFLREYDPTFAFITHLLPIIGWIGISIFFIQLYRKQK